MINGELIVDNFAGGGASNGFSLPQKIGEIKNDRRKETD